MTAETEKDLTEKVRELVIAVENAAFRYGIHSEQCEKERCTACEKYRQRCTALREPLLALIDAQAKEIAELKAEREEALCLAEGPSSLLDIARECGRARMNEDAQAKEVAELRAAILRIAEIAAPEDAWVTEFDEIVRIARAALKGDKS